MLHLPRTSRGCPASWVRWQCIRWSARTAWGGTDRAIRSVSSCPLSLPLPARSAAVAPPPRSTTPSGRDPYQRESENIILSEFLGSEKSTIKVIVKIYYLYMEIVNKNKKKEESSNLWSLKIRNFNLICLNDPDDIMDSSRWDAQTCAGASNRSVRWRHIGICS